MIYLTLPFYAKFDLKLKKVVKDYRHEGFDFYSLKAAIEFITLQ
ncbi:hypothetical protein [uncultured Flavobacterium sp.]|nr:hypothetical protein [uncultured Flavobacterium sp.]